VSDIIDAWYNYEVQENGHSLVVPRTEIVYVFSVKRKLNSFYKLKCTSKGKVQPRTSYEGPKEE
jgi:hypothetical protein